MSTSAGPGISQRDQTLITRGHGITRTIVLAAAIAIIVSALYLAGAFLIPILVGFWIAALCLPIVHFLRRKGVPKTLAAVIPSVTILLVMAVVGFFVIAWIADLEENLPTYQAQIAERRADLDVWLIDHGITVPASEVDEQAGLEKLVSLLSAVLPSLVDFAVGAVFVILILTYMLLESDAAKRRLSNALGPDSPHLTRIRDFIDLVSTAMAARAILGLAAAVCDGVMLLILGVPYVGLWVVTSFICSFIPYVGYWLALIPPMLVALATLGLTEAVIVFLGYWLINGFFDSVIGPKFQGDKLNLSPVVTMVAVLFWGSLFGAVGGMLALPLTLGIKLLLLDAFPESRWLSLAIEADVPAMEESTEDEVPIEVAAS